jgi:hypothetical protein
MSSNNELISSLKDFSLDESFIEKLLKIQIQKKEEIQIKEKQSNIHVKKDYNMNNNNNNSNNNKKEELTKFVKPKDKFFIPKEKDKLFWCFYIMKNDYIQYEMLENRNLIIEKKIKIEYVEKIRKDKQAIKTYKFTTLTNMENNLVNEEKINIGTFLSLCVFENINILYIKNKTYYELLMNDSKEIFIIYELDYKKFGIEKNTRDNSDNIKNNLFQLNNIEKPIKAISSYKLQELIDISNKLGIETIHKITNKSKNKTELYEEIVKSF